MKVIVDGVSITLTKTQVNHINKVKAERLKNLKTFEDALKRFGFKRHRDTRDKGYNCDHCYANDEKGWYAEIYDGDRVWMVGNELKASTSFPGGWMYWTIKELIDELSNK